jgi:hypothetical protein
MVDLFSTLAILLTGIVAQVKPVRA